LFSWQSEAQARCSGLAEAEHLPPENMAKTKRRVEVVVISDVHLGTYGCHAKELLKYLKSIKPKKLVLNGDIIDMWQFKKSYWPKSHMKVVKHLTGLISKGVPVYYVTGNHDEMLRKFVGFKLSSFKIVNKLVLDLNGEKAWIFHGDVFDVTMKHSKWLAKLGGKGYDLLILLNRMINIVSQKMGYGKISLSKKIKDNVKSAVKYINNFEKVAADLAIDKGYAYVVCGHIHQPVIQEISNSKGKVTYLNSGDWVENLTALEYNEGKWSIYKFDEDKHAPKIKIVEDSLVEMSNHEIFARMVREFEIAS
jgi:UDP-2,3-diacylglucosamine pyrophosphatase LpxH